MGAADLRQPSGESDQACVSLRPVDPGGRVVLGVGVVVAVLAVAEFGAHRQHRRAAREIGQRQQIAHVAGARGEDRGVVRRAFDAVVPRGVVVGPVAIVFAVGLVVLVGVGDDIGEGEAVVGDDVVDALGGRRRVGEDVARAGDAGREFAAGVRLAAPKMAHGVAEAVVPLAPAVGKIAEPIAFRPEIPRLGDQLGLRQDRIGGERLEQRRLLVEAPVASPDCNGEIEAESVKAAERHPAPERGERHARRPAGDRARGNCRSRCR